MHLTVLMLAALPVISALRVSNNARCGSTFDLTCQGSKYGNCCSQYGYCGSTSDYCSNNKGCQSGFGTCIGGQAPPPNTFLTATRPGATVTSYVTVTKGTAQTTTVTVAGQGITQTVTISGEAQTVTKPISITIPGEAITVTAPTTLTIPGAGEVTTVTLPGQSTTVTLPGETKTLTVPGADVVTTVVQSASPLAASTITVVESASPLAASTITVVESASPLAASKITVIESASPLAASTVTVIQSASPLAASTITVSGAVPTVATCAAVPNPSVTQVVTNPSFETNDAWVLSSGTNGVLAYANDDANTGSRSLRLTATRPQDISTTFSQSVSLFPNAIYRLTVYGKSSLPSNCFGPTARIGSTSITLTGSQQSATYTQRTGLYYPVAGQTTATLFITAGCLQAQVARTLSFDDVTLTIEGYVTPASK